VAKELGATHLINYHKVPDWASKVLEVTGGKGVDLVVDVVGAGDIEETLRCTAFGGMVINVGLLGKEDQKRVNIMTQILYGAKTGKHVVPGCHNREADL
jgi:NADPH:quinone reductase-like Zn-dependent oxidoreductase